MHRLFLFSEWGVGEGAFLEEDGRPADLGLPYTNWFEAIPHCVKALRRENIKSEGATLLELKYNIRYRRFRQAGAIAKRWIKGVTPNCPYCYYALSMDGDHRREALSWAKKGESSLILRRPSFRKHTLIAPSDCLFVDPLTSHI